MHHKLHVEFRSRWTEPKEACLDIDDLCEALTRTNVRKLKMYRVPLLYQSGVVYHKGMESFTDCTEVYARGWGACCDLAPWRAAEHRLRGVNAVARTRFEGVYGEHPHFHVYVTLPNGTVEDPSVLLGMRSL